MHNLEHARLFAAHIRRTTVTTQTHTYTHLSRRCRSSAAQAERASSAAGAGGAVGSGIGRVEVEAAIAALLRVGLASAREIRSYVRALQRGEAGPASGGGGVRVTELRREEL